MSLIWQDITALALVAAAALYLARRVWRAARGRKAGGCGRCGTCAADEPQQLVTLEQSKR